MEDWMAHLQTCPVVCVWNSYIQQLSGAVVDGWL